MKKNIFCVIATIALIFGTISCDKENDTTNDTVNNPTGIDESKLAGTWQVVKSHAKGYYYNRSIDSTYQLEYNDEIKGRLLIINQEGTYIWDDERPGTWMVEGDSIFFRGVLPGLYGDFSTNIKYEKIEKLTDTELRLSGIIHQEGSYWGPNDEQVSYITDEGTFWTEFKRTK